jgi:glycosyltransferase involved in cell wall biosynthesis
VIGKNEEAHLSRCLDSIRSQSYPGPRETIYVDGRSTDRSLAVAHAHDGVTVLCVDDTRPNAAKGRNKGWREAGGELIQFVDADAALASDWTAHAVEAMRDPRVAAVFGWYRERHPERSIYNRVFDLDWPQGAGPADTFGGIVMVRRSCLLETGGFPEAALSGEDPLLALDLRRRGRAVEQLPVPMADHDLDLHDFGKYWRRCVNTGVSYAVQVAAKRALGVPLLRTRTAKNACAAAMGALVTAIGFWFPLVWMAAALVLLADVMRLALRHRRRAGGFGIALAYALHLRLAILAQLIGLLRWWRQRRATTAGQAPVS